jgi:hypothetical protein
MVTEKQLHSLWMRSIHLVNGLKTTCGKTIKILHPGYYNRDQGQDFKMVKLELDGQVWMGNVEIHIKTSDWYRHNHQNDSNYCNTILHVVWLHDTEMFTLSPVLALSDYDFLHTQLKVDKDFSFYQLSKPDINGAIIEKFNQEKNDWGLKRLKRRAEQLITELELNIGDWEQTIWMLLAKTFGSRVNGLAFSSMATSFPFWILKINQYNRLSLEALFMGQLGLLLKDPVDNYLIDLNLVYFQFQKKYHLKPIIYPVYLLRMRPNNFPTIRLSQLAAYLSAGHFNLNLILQAKTISCFNNLSTIETSDYWKTHLMPEKNCSPFKGVIGKQMTVSVIINVYLTYLFAVGLITKQDKLLEKALNLLHQIPPEDNAITRNWIEEGGKIVNAFESQALLEFQQSFLQKNN